MSLLQTKLAKLRMDTQKASFLSESQKQMLLALMDGKPFMAPEMQASAPLSVQWFKIPHLQSRIHNECHDEHVFYSSGTTQRSQQSRWHGRSKSVFSRAGLWICKVASLMSFLRVLQRSGYPPEDFVALSLIPPVHIWPHSSLAQMIAWFGEFFPLSYRDTLDDVQRMSEKSPLWIFATAAHYFSLWPKFPALQATGKWPLATTSCSSLFHAKGQASRVFAFETGGLKALDLPWDNRKARHLLYLCMQDMLGIPLDHIGSEYGSCELACQAWSFREKGNLPAYAAPYVFPSYVAWGVCKGYGSYEWLTNDCEDCELLIGDHFITGELVIYDPLRIDVPYALAMEDMITARDAGFFIVDRVNDSPLRGCSLDAGEMFSAASESSSSNFECYGFSLDLVDHKREQHDLSFVGGECFHKLTQSLSEFMASKHWYDACKREFLDAKIAKKAQEDLLASIPHTSCDLQQALQASEISNFLPQKHTPILFVLPRSHSLASLYPLLFAALRQAKIYVRLPSHFGQPNTPIIRFFKWLKEVLGVECKGVSESFRLSRSTRMPQDMRLFFHGATTTLQELQALMPPGYVAGFGGGMSVSVLFDPDKHSLFYSISDAYALKQRGCMSAKMLVLPSKSYKQFCEVTRSLNLCLDIVEACSIEAKRRAMVSENVAYIHSCGMLFSLHFLRKQDLLRAEESVFARFLHRSPMSLAVVFLDDLAEELQNEMIRLQEHHELRYVSTDNRAFFCKPEFSSLTLRYPGKLDIQPWDGYFEKKPLFACVNV